MTEPGEDVTRISQSRPPGDGRGGRDDGGSGHGWQLATVGLIALILGGGVGLLLAGGGDETTQTVRAQPRTVTATATATTPSSVGVTVTTPERTVERTVTGPPQTVTVTVAETTPEG